MNDWSEIIQAVAAEIHARNPGRAAELVELAGLPQGVAYCRARGFEIDGAAGEASDVLSCWKHGLYREGPDVREVTLKLTGPLIALPGIHRATLESAERVRVIIEDCPGGNLSVAVELLGLLVPRNASVQVTGAACSAGAVLGALLPGRRTLSPSAELTFHPPTLLLMGDAGELRRHAGQLESMTAGLVEAMSLRTGQPRSTVERWLSGPDVVFDAPGAVACGLADAVEEAP